MPKVIEINCATGEEVEREMSDKELKHYEAVQEAYESKTE